MRDTLYKHYVLCVLTVTLLFNYLDRVALGLVLQDIKVDLNLTDTQLGLLTGIAFALFYSIMGVPIARWADRGNRITITTVVVVLWSIGVALCGFATTFLQLLLVRVAVAVGEAGCLPCGFSLLADYFKRAERPRAVAVYGMGATLSVIIGYLLAGWLNALYGWRVTFILLGSPGLVLAAVVWFTLKDPRYSNSARHEGRIASPKEAELLTSQPSLKEVFVTLWSNVTFRHLLAALSILLFFNTGITQWLPTFFIRSYGLPTAEVGMWLAVAFGTGGLFGAYIGGELATRYAVHNERLQLRAMALTVSCASVLSTLTYLMPSPYFAFVLIGLYVMGLSAINGPLFATIQTLVPEHMRAMAFALAYLAANLVGMGFGPLAVGVLSDQLRPLVGEESLRYALLILGPGFLLGSWHAWRASRTVERDIRHVESTAEQLSDGREALSPGPMHSDRCSDAPPLRV